MLEPSFRLGVLGRVDGVARDAGGHLLLVVRYGGALGLGTRLIAVPLDTAGAMGPYVQIIDIAPSQLAALPTLDAASLSKLDDGDIVSIGLGMKQR